MESPYYRLYTKQPDLKSLKVFGCAIYPWLRPFNVNKLQLRSEMCIFLGYSMGYKWVICYNLTNGKSIISRHVIFYETTFPSTKVPRLLAIEQPAIRCSRPISVLILIPVSMGNSVQEIMTNPSHAENTVSSMHQSKKRLFNDTSSSGAPHPIVSSTNLAS